MKKKYFLTLGLLIAISNFLNAQTTVNYLQQTGNYFATFTDSGGNFNNGATEFGMWANGGGAKYSVAWRNFTNDGSTGGTTSSMEVGDSFTITVSHTRAFGQIGIALLESPATTSWADRLSNYAVQVNLNGSGGAFDPWEVVPSAGATVASAINGNDDAAGPVDTVLKFTRSSATEITVDINGGAFSTIVTPTSVSGINAYSVYLNDDWNGAANSNIFWKPTSEFVDNNLTTWTGTTDTDWTTGTNWSSGNVPISTKDVIIPNLGNDPVISATTGAVANNITITDGVLSITNGGSLIANGTVTGNLTYNIHTPDTNWHLVSPPVTNETIDDAWVLANSLSIGILDPANRGAAGYDNSTDADGDWNYFTAGNSFSLTSGEGFSLQRTGAGDYGLTGTYTASPVSFTATQASGASGNDWNLLGNPFAAYIDIAAFITANTANFSGAYQALYVWDNGAGAYVPKTTGYFQPGQGFFVNADAGIAITYTSAMQSHQTGVTFYRTTNTDFVINLTLTDGSKTKTTEISYIDDKTTGLDPRFDIGAFSGENTSFALYSQLISDNNGINFMRQALPNSDYENMIIPIGVNATAGTELTFTANIANLPTGLNVYIENRTANTFTKLSENGNYTITLDADSNGIGQFYLRTPSGTLSVNNVLLDNVSLYKTSNTSLRIVGLQQGKASIKIVNLLGKQMISKSFTTNGVSDVSLPKLATGIYIVQLQTENGKLNKKIIIE